MLSGCVVPFNSFYHGNLNVCFIMELTTCSKSQRSILTSFLSRFVVLVCNIKTKCDLNMYMNKMILIKYMIVAQNIHSTFA